MSSVISDKYSASLGRDETLRHTSHKIFFLPTIKLNQIYNILKSKLTKSNFDLLSKIAFQSFFTACWNI